MNRAEDSSEGMTNLCPAQRHKLVYVSCAHVRCWKVKMSSVMSNWITREQLSGGLGVDVEVIYYYVEGIIIIIIIIIIIWFN